jgi:hypothetical protein
MVELYELQSGILDREQQVAQTFTSQVVLRAICRACPRHFWLQGVGFEWLNQNSALLAFRTGELAAVAVQSSSRETCLCVLHNPQVM